MSFGKILFVDDQSCNFRSIDRYVMRCRLNTTTTVLMIYPSIFQHPVHVYGDCCLPSESGVGNVLVDPHSISMTHHPVSVCRGSMS